MITRWETDVIDHPRLLLRDRTTVPKTRNSITNYKTIKDQSAVPPRSRSGRLMLLKYFSLRSLIVMVALTASLLLLPLVLPPLPPPPSTLLLVPVMIMVLLVFLALSPSDVPNYVALAATTSV